MSIRLLESGYRWTKFTTLETVAGSLELAAEALELSAQTSRNLDRLESDIVDLKQIVGIVISESQADRVRFDRLESQH